MKLNLGCGRSPLAGWVNVDRQALDGVDVMFDLDRCGTTPLPFDDDTVTEIQGVDLIEHIADPLALMQELWRVARSGAPCRFWLPYGSSDDAWEDPTHVRPYFLNSWAYFGQPAYWRADYGYRGDWSAKEIVLDVRCPVDDRDHALGMVSALRNIVTRQAVELVAVRPARAAEAALATTPNITLRPVARS